MKMKNDIFELPTIEVVALDAVDVITASNSGALRCPNMSVGAPTI